jgi:hypothetical protein
MVAGSVRQAASHLAKAFRDHLQPSPLHLPGSAQLRPSTHSLFSAFANADLAPNRQRAITPKLLRAMCTLAGLEFRETHDSPAAAAADLAILSFFFATMRLCENAAAPQPGLTKTKKKLGFLFYLRLHESTHLTKTVDMLGVVFLDKDHRETPQDHPGISLAACVTLLFAGQKNRDKNARRTQKRTNDPVLCPVRRAASPIERIRRLVVGFLGSTTIINTHTHQSSQGLVSLQLASGFLRSQLRHTCSTLGGKKVFGFDKMDIGTKSVRCRCGLVPS